MPGGTLSGQIKYKGYCVLHPQHAAGQYASDNGVIAFEEALREVGKGIHTRRMA